MGSEKNLRTGFYLRVSKVDKRSDFQEESNSIQNQRLLLFQYTKIHQEFVQVQEYVDDGYSGSDFKRPGFQRLIRDVEAKKIDCILVKDLSRFGRDYLRCGWYIETYFPRKGIRFLAITEQYDSEESREADQIIVPFYNLMNDVYLEDISCKIKNSLMSRWKQGAYTGNFAPFGYQKRSEDKSRLQVDHQAALVVRRIYLWYLEGKNPIAIAALLEQLCLPSPLEYKCQKNIPVNENFLTHYKGKWTPSAVARILGDPVYTGCLAQGRTVTEKRGIKRTLKQKREDWVWCSDCHRAVIPGPVHTLVQTLRQQDTRSCPHKRELATLSGLVKCAVCKENMIRKSMEQNKRKYLYYLCSGARRGECTQKANVDGICLEQTVQKVLCRLYGNKKRIQQQDRAWRELIRENFRREISKLELVEQELQDSPILTAERGENFLHRIQKELDRVRTSQKIEENKLQRKEPQDSQIQDIQMQDSQMQNSEMLWSRKWIVLLIRRIEVLGPKEIQIKFWCKRSRDGEGQ